MSGKVFKIRRKSDGLFSEGSFHPRFTAKGKVWRNKQSIQAHFGQFDPERLRKSYKDCELVVCELVVTEATSMEQVSDRRERNIILKKKHGEDFANLVDTIVDKDQTNDFPYVASLNESYYKTDQFRPLIAQAIKANGTKKSEFRQRGMVLAFSSKKAALLFKLSMSSNVSVYDIATLVEVNDN